MLASVLLFRDQKLVKPYTLKTLANDRRAARSRFCDKGVVAAYLFAPTKRCDEYLSR